jgi:capsular polysaccharide biosynthesis protein
MKLYRDTIRQALTSEPSSTKKRILIARKPGTKVRRIINHDEVVEMTTALGFQTVYFEELALREQLHLATSAEAMIGAHGSGLCHLLFMDELSTVVEIFPFERRQACDCYEMLATIPRHRYHSIDSSEEREGDIVVAVRELRDMLRGALGV